MWDAESNFKRLKEENPDLVIAAGRGNSVVDPEARVKKIEETHVAKEEVAK